MNLGHIKAKSDERLPKMDQWSFQPHGRYLISAERDVLATVLPKLFGYYILQLGGPVKSSLIDSSAIDNHIRLTMEPSPGFDGESVLGDPYNLPFEPESIDVIVMPHVLEYLENPKAVIKSVYDTLIPEGTVIIFGINPNSLWGIAKCLHRNRMVYRRGTSHYKSTVIHWLKEAGFDIIKRKTLCFRWPSASEQFLKRSKIMEPIGQLMMPTFGGVYMIVARKRVEKVIAVMPNLAVPVQKGYVEPAP